MLITEYEEATQLLADNVFLQDGPGGTQKTTAYNLAKRLPLLLNSDLAAMIKQGDKINIQTEDGIKTFKMTKDSYYDFLDEFITLEDRKNTFRGKNLGDHVTDERYARIADGTFKGFFIGDYWLINNKHWRIADINYFIGNGYPANITAPHLVIFPDEKLADSKMNEANTTAGGYLGSVMHKETLPKIQSEQLDPIFGGHFLTIGDWLSNVVTNGIITGGAWTNIIASLPTEAMIYNTRNFSSMTSANTEVSLLYSIFHEQLSLLKLNAFFINPGRYWYWLRDVCNSSSFARSGYGGPPDYHTASHVGCVRPVFGITG